MGPARRAVRFVEDRFVRPDGMCIEKVVLARRDDPVTRSLLARRRRLVAFGGYLLVVFPAETRLWGYGALLGAFARGEALGLASVDELSPVLARLLTVHAAHENGRFAYLPTDPAAFPRHESHLFEGLAAVARTLAERRAPGAPADC